MGIGARFMLAATLAVGTTVGVGAYSVQPMIYTLAPAGSGASVRVSVVNSREGLLNVELEPYAVTADDTGKRTFTPAPDDFLIFPPQASIQADKTQLFQVRYVGPSSLNQGRVYVLRVHQTNTSEMTKVDPTAAVQAKLGLSVNFNTTAIVQPDTLEPDVALERELAPDGNGVLRGRLINRGAGVADFTRLQWLVTRDGKQEAIPIDQVKYGDAVFLEPGRSRDISLSETIKGPAQLVLKQRGNKRGGSNS